MKDNLLPVVLSHDTFWAIEPNAGLQLKAQLEAISQQAHVAEWLSRQTEQTEAFQEDAAIEPQSRAQVPYDMDGGIAVLTLSGPMTKKATSWDSGTSTLELRRKVRMAAADDDVKAILLKVDSPGGSVAGTAELAADVAAAAKIKPVWAYIEDCGCSAAYWVASQATKLYANATALVGNIGTLLVLADMSKAAEAAGVEVLVFSTGPYKGAGAPGAEITEDQRAYFQKTVDDLNIHFKQGVARGRRMSKTRVNELADGRYHVGVAAHDQGLVDDIASFDDVFTSLRAKVKGAKASALTQGEPHSGIRFEDHLESALSAVAEVNARAEDISQWRIDHGRPPMSEARLVQLKTLHSELGSIIEASDPSTTATAPAEPEGISPERQRELALKTRTLALATAVTRQESSC